MGIPAQPPPSMPPQQQQQQQQQQETQTIGELLQQQQAESKSESKADSTTVSSNSQQNIQVNNTSNRLEYGTFKIPETTLSISAYSSIDGDTGAVATLNVPIGGKSRKAIRQALVARVAIDELEYERTYLSACASISEQGSEWKVML